MSVEFATLPWNVSIAPVSCRPPVPRMPSGCRSSAHRRREGTDRLELVSSNVTFAWLVSCILLPTQDDVAVAAGREQLDHRLDRDLTAEATTRSRVATDRTAVAPAGVGMHHGQSLIRKTRAKAARTTGRVRAGGPVVRSSDAMTFARARDALAAAAATVRVTLRGTVGRARARSDVVIRRDRRRAHRRRRNRSRRSRTTHRSGADRCSRGPRRRAAPRGCTYTAHGR